MTEKPLFNPEGLFPSSSLQTEPSGGPLKLSQWSSTSGADLSDADKVMGYSNYLRQYNLDQGSLNRETEMGITAAATQMLREVDPAYKMSMDIGTVDTDASLIQQAFGEESKNNFLDALNKGYTRNDFVEEINEAKQHLVEQGTLKLASLKKQSAEGNPYFEVIGTSNIVDKNKAINDSINAGALRHRDMWQVPIGLEELSQGVSRFKAITANKIRNEFADASKSEQYKDFYEQVRKDAKEHFSTEGNDPAALITKARTLLAATNKGVDILDNEGLRSRFDDEDIMGVLEQFAVSDQYESGEAKFISDPKRLSENIKITGNGHAVAHLQLILDKEKFDKALDQKDLTSNQRDQLQNYRTWWYESYYDSYDELFSDSTVSDEWSEAKVQGKSENQTNGEILEKFLSDDSNYSGISNRLGLFVDSIKDSFSGLVAVAPALFGNKKAIDHLVKQEQDRSNRREVAKVFGDEFGLIEDLGGMIAPVLTDIGATAMLSAATRGVGGVAYLSGKQGVKLTTKGLVTSMSGSILSKQFGETARDTAVRISARKLIEVSGQQGAKGTMDAIKAYNKLASTKFFRRGTQTPFLFLTAANRSAGGTYATVYSNIDGTHEEKHDAALGAALRAGTATGLITSAFSFVGAGGLEDALLRGMTYSQKAFMLNRMAGSPLTQLNVKKTNEVIKQHITKRLNDITKKGFGDIYQRFLRAGTEEFVEEALDEFVNQTIVDASLDRDTPFIDKISGAMYAGLLGGIIGQGAVGARSILNKNSREASSIFMAQEEDALINALRESGSPLTANVLSNVRSSQLTQGELSELAVERQTRQLLRMPAGAELPTTGPAIDVAEEARLAEQSPINKTSSELKQQRLNDLENPNPKDQQEAGEIVTQINNSEVEINVEEVLKSEDFQNFSEEQAATGTKEENIEKNNVVDPNVELQQAANQQIENDIEASSKLESDTDLSEEEQSQLEKKFQDNLSNMLNIVDGFGAKIQFDDEAKTAFAFNTRTQSIIINKGQVAGLIHKLNPRNGKALTKAILTEELIHKGSYNILTRGERKAVFDTLSKSDQDRLVDNYYRTPEDRAAAKQRLAENDIRERDTVVEELLRMEAQKAMSGFTSEENYEFFSQNPSALRVFLRYLGNLISRLRRYFEAEPDNPYLAATTNRVIRAYNAMKNGFEVTSLPAFSPDNPANTFELIASQIRTEGEKPFSDVEGINEVAGQRVVDAATNAEYLELAKDPEKNKQALQDMVDKAAIAAGYLSTPSSFSNPRSGLNEMYHGTASEFDAFSYNKIGTGAGFQFGTGFYFSEAKEQAEYYTGPADEDGSREGKILSAYLKVENPKDYFAPPLEGDELRSVLSRIAEMELQDMRAEDPEASIDDTFLSDYGGMEGAIELLSNETKIADQLGSMLGSGIDAKYTHQAVKEITGTDALVGYDWYGLTTVVLTPEQIKLSDPVTYDAEGNVIPLAERFDETTDELVRSSIVADAKYLELANDPKKNKQELQDMVDRAAIQAGYTPTNRYHGTRAFKFDAFDNFSTKSNDVGFHFGTKQAAEDRIEATRPAPTLKRGEIKFESSSELRGNKGKIYTVYLKTQNPLRLDEQGTFMSTSVGWDIGHILRQIFEGDTRSDNKGADHVIPQEFESDADAYFEGMLTTEMVYDGQLMEVDPFELFTVFEETKWMDAYLKSKGFDSIVYNNKVEDSGNDSYIVFNPNNIKSSDPVTKDAEGNIIPLSQRFDSTTDKLVRSSIVSGVEYRVHDAQSLIDETFANNAIGVDRDPIDSGLRGSRVHEIAKLFDSLIKDEERIIWNESKEGTDKYAENVSRAGDRVANLLHRSIDEYPQFATWYEERIDMAMDIFEELDPDISKPENSFVLKILLAVTSNGAKVLAQTKDSWNIYKEWKKTGKLNNAVRSSGDRGDQVAKHLADTDKFIERVGWEKLKAFFDRSGTVAEVRDALVSDLGVDSEVAKDILESKGELIDEVVPFSIFYGPKLGSFYHNLNGKFDSITMDRWFLRTFGKLTGTQLKKISRKVMAEKRDRFSRAFRAYVASDPKGGLLSAAKLSTRLKDPKGETRDNVVAALVKYFAKKPNRSFYYDKKTGDRIPTDEKLIPKKAPKLADLRLAANGLKLYLDGVNVKDHPEGGGHRRFTRQAMLDGINKLEQRTGTKLVPAEAQALLWYYEKETHRLFGSAQERDPDYGSAANEVFRNERGEDALNFRPSIGNRRRSEQRTDDIGSDARVDRTGEDVLESDDEVIASQLSPDTASKKALARFGNLTGMLKVPQFYSGKYRGKFTGLKKWLNGVAGEADPRLRELYENELNLRNAVGDQVTLWRDKLEELVAKDYPEGNPPIDLFRKITGDPEGMSLSQNTVGYINNLVGKAKKKIIAEKKKAQANLTPKDLAYVQAEEKYVADLAVVDKYKTNLYNKAYAAQKKVMQREKNEAIEELGGFDNDGVPKSELAIHLLGLRTQIDEFSKAIRDLYPNDPESKERLQATIDKNLEVYLTRSYRLFTEAGFIRKVMYDPNYASTRKNAVKFFEDQYIKERSRTLFKNEEIATLQQAEEQALQELRDSPIEPDSGLTELTHGLMLEFLNMYSPKSSGWLQVTPQMSFRGGKSFGTVLADKLKDRKNIPQELKALMGEEVDATGYDAALRTYMHVGIMASHQAFLRNLVEVGRGQKEGEKWLLTLDEVNKEPDKQDYELIDLRSDKAYNPFVINGKTLYAHKDLIEAVRAMGSSNEYVLNETDKAASVINRAIGSMTGTAMAAKTLGSVGFYMRNALGNVLYFGLSQGNLPTLSMGKTFVKEIGRKKLFFLRGKLNREAVQAYYSELKALGVIGDELRPKMLEELFGGDKTPAQMMEEATGVVEEIGKMESIKNKSKAVTDKINSLYTNLKDLSAAMDTFYKIDYFERELKTIRKAVAAAKSDDTEYFQLSEYDMQRKAARIVKRTAQSFSQAMPFVKGWAKSSVGQMFAPFVRFKGEVARITVNTTKLAFQELAHPNKVIRLRGARRLAGQTAVMGGVSAMVPVLLRLAQNITDEEDESLRATTVSYLKNHTFFIMQGMIPKVQDEGKLYTYDFTYLNPFSLVVDPFLRSFEKIAQGKDTGEIMKVFAESMIFDQYLDEQIFAGALLALRKNKDPETGRAIWGTKEDSLDQFSKMGIFLWKEAFEPRIIKTGREVAKGLTVDKERALERALLRIAEEFLPLKPYELDLRTNLSRYMNNIRMETQIASRGKNQAFYADKMSKQDVFDIVEKELEYKKNIDREAHKVFKGIMELSKKTDTPITEDELRKIAVSNQIGKRRFSLIMRGMTETPRKANIDFQKRLRAKMQEDPKFVERADQFNEAYKSYSRYLFH